MKMIIVDDDRLLRESLSKLIDWSSINVTVVGTACNGKESLDLINSLTPDIVLADIEMPELSGIELIKYIQLNNISCKVIFLSAYSSFVYAQEAIKYGAFSYLLKPVNEEQLLQTVASCCSCIAKTMKEQDLINKSIDMHEAATINALKAILLSDVSTNDPLQTVTITAENSIALAIYIKNHFDAAETSIMRELNSPNSRHSNSSVHYKFQIEDLPKYDCYEMGSHYVIDLDINTTVVICFSYKNHESELFTRAIELVDSLKPKCYGISSIRLSSEIYTLYEESAFATLLPTFDSSVLPYFQNLEILDKHAPKMGWKNIVDYLEGNPDQKADVLKSLFLSFTNDGTLCDIHNMKLMCISLLDNIGNSRNPFTCDQQEWESDFMFSFKKALLVCNSPDSLYAEMDKILECLFSNDRSLSPKSPIIKDVIRYIRENYNSASLTEISSMLFLSPSYLSRLFASNMNESFSRYLMRYRIERAKEMMHDPSKKMYEIATSVGYSDLAHFSTAFKAIEGISPGKYKDIISSK